MNFVLLEKSFGSSVQKLTSAGALCSLILGTSVTASPVFAEGLTSEQTAKIILDAQCSAQGLAAGYVMRKRQNREETLADMMSRDVEPKARPMILEAFEMPVMQTAETRQLVIDEFANKWALRCYRDGPFLANHAKNPAP